MASFREISAFKTAPHRARDLAKQLLASYADDLDDWETQFLSDMSAFDDPELSTRQAESLLQVRDDHERLSVVDGFSVAGLLQSCLELRDDLSEDDAEAVVQLRGANKLSRKRVLWLLGRARELGVVERYIHVR